MDTKIYALLDTVAQDFGPPFVAINDGVAKRQSRQLLAQAVHMADFELYCIGDYDTATGEIQPCLQPVLIPLDGVGVVRAPGGEQKEMEFRLDPKSVEVIR